MGQGKAGASWELERLEYEASCGVEQISEESFFPFAGIRSLDTKVKVKECTS